MNKYSTIITEIHLFQRKDGFFSYKDYNMSEILCIFAHDFNKQDKI